MVKFAEKNACLRVHVVMKITSLKGKVCVVELQYLKYLAVFHRWLSVYFPPNHCVSRQGFINTELGVSGQISLGCAIQNVA